MGPFRVCHLCIDTMMLKCLFVFSCLSTAQGFSIPDSPKCVAQNQAAEAERHQNVMLWNALHSSFEYMIVEFAGTLVQSGKCPMLRTIQDISDLKWCSSPACVAAVKSDFSPIADGVFPACRWPAVNANIKCEVEHLCDKAGESFLKRALLRPVIAAGTAPSHQSFPIVVLAGVAGGL